MADEEQEEQPPEEEDEETREKERKALDHVYQKTRKSLIARLDNWEDQKTWDEFYQTYWRLIYSVALKSGLRNEEAFDAVQETILSIAKQSKKKLYDPEQGSFKTWLMNMTRWRINDQFRKRRRIPPWRGETGMTRARPMSLIVLRTPKGIYLGACGKWNGKKISPTPL